jgi:hypothetical protein
MAAIPMLGGNSSSRPLLALPDQPATGGDYQKAARDAAGRMRESPIFTPKERHIGNGWPIVTSLIHAHTWDEKLRACQVGCGAAL